MSQYESNVKALSEHDADINKKYISEESPLFVARKDKPKSIADILLEHGAKSRSSYLEIKKQKQ